MDIIGWMIGLTILMPISMWWELDRKQRWSIGHSVPTVYKVNPRVEKILTKLLYEKKGKDARFIYYSKRYILFHSILSILLLVLIYLFELYYSKSIVISYVVFVHIECVPVFALVVLIIIDDFVSKPKCKN